jgi:hypothetical protein
LSYFHLGRFLIQKTLTSGSHLSDAARRAGPAWQRVVATWLPRAMPLQRVKSVVGIARRRPDSVVPIATPPLSEPPHAASPRPSQQRSSRSRHRPVRSQQSLSERPDRRCTVASAVVSTSTVSVARALLSPFFVRGVSSSPSPPSSPSQDRRRPP